MYLLNLLLKFLKPYFSCREPLRYKTEGCYFWLVYQFLDCSKVWQIVFCASVVHELIFNYEFERLERNGICIPNKIYVTAMLSQFCNDLYF